MRTNDDGNPDFADILESGKAEVGRYARMEADGFGKSVRLAQSRTKLDGRTPKSAAASFVPTSS